MSKSYNEYNKITNAKKGMSPILKFFLGFIIVIAILIAVPVFIVWSKVSKVDYVPIDKEQLAVNSNIYNEVSEELTESEFDDIVTVALFGTDSRDANDMEAGRADTIMIASVNPKNKSIKLISIPRDTYVDVSGYGKTKINHAYAYGGEQLTINTINSNFGLNITQYATIDFAGLISVINDVGGINLNITKDEMDALNEYLRESYKVSGNTYTPMTKYGNVTLNGEQALALSRDRSVGDDFTRADRQRDVLMALFEKVSKMEKTKIFSLLDSFLAQVKTNVNIASYTGLMTSVVSNMGEYKDNIISTQIPSAKYSSGEMISGTYYFVTDIDKAKDDFITYLYKK